MSFEKLIFDKNINKALIQNNYKNPTQIQKEVIPLILKGKDVIAKAQTSSGKTASFVLPLLDLWLERQKTYLKKKTYISTLILTPTRDLTIQVAETFKLFSQYFNKKPKIATIIGGLSIGEQLLEVQKGCDIIVATSGRLLDIMDKKQIDLSKVEYFILDEADKMLDLGFSIELDDILKMLPTNRQNLMFTATYPTKMLQIASKITKNPIKITIANQLSTKANINQRVIEVNKQNKSPLLQHLIRTNKWERVLVFMATKRACDNIATKFRRYGFLAESFHGDLTQQERNYTLQDFKDKKIKILFSTDIASRGLHIEDISCVINFDLPRASDDYIHRIGRTARAGKSGDAITFIGHENQEHFKLIEKKCTLDIAKEQIKDFELTGKTIIKTKGQAPIKGKRKSKKDKLREQQKNQSL